MNGNPKVSVIVPIYKAESYLYKCIDSLLTQTLADIEILLIDDGSLDGSGMICDEYARKDSCVKVFHKSNGGVASARQCGLDHACGEYVIHADPDDWVESDMLQSLYEKAVEEDADMVICDFYYEIDETEGYVRVCQQPETLDHMTVLKNLFQQLHGSCWNKLLRRVCCSKYNVHFDLNLSFCEDLYFNASLLLYPLRIAYLSRAFYHYVQNLNPESLSFSYNKSSFQYDRMLKGKFCRLLAQTSVYPVCEMRLDYLIVYRAYEGRVFSSREFKKCCEPYRKLAVQACPSLLMKIRFYLACRGLYSLVYKLHSYIVKFR